MDNWQASILALEREMAMATPQAERTTSVFCYLKVFAGVLATYS